jgi:hypothetical protein
MARAGVIAILSLLVILPLVLLFPISTSSVDSLGWSYFGLVALDGFLTICVLSFASWNRIFWESFLRPKRGFGSVVGSLATIVGVVFAEIGLGILFIIVALVSTDCSNGRTYTAGTCDLHTTTAYASDALSGLMVLGAMAACLALARVFILFALAVDAHQSTKLS